MEAASLAAPAGSSETGDKGLKKDALGFASSLVIGVASTAPGYSLAASLGLVVVLGASGCRRRRSCSSRSCRCC